MKHSVADTKAIESIVRPCSFTMYTVSGEVDNLASSRLRDWPVDG